MARIRAIHARATQDDDVASLPFEARVLWAYLPCYADRQGRLEDRPLMLKGSVFPTDDVDVNEMLASFAERGWIIRYVASGKKLIQIVSFHDYQRPDHHERESVLPAPEGWTGDKCPGNAQATPRQRPGKATETGTETAVCQGNAAPVIRYPVSGPDLECVSVQKSLPLLASGSGEEQPACQDEPKDAEKIRAVFAHYRTYHPRSFRTPVSTSNEWKKIQARLREGYTVEDLCKAIDGYHKSPHHLGTNDTGTQYLGLELFVRDGTHVSAGIAFADKAGGPVLSERERRSMRAAEAFIAKGDGDRG